MFGFGIDLFRGIGDWFDFVEATIAGGNPTLPGEERRDQAGTVGYNFPYYYSLSLGR